jgi:hypothetical protein
LTVTRGQEGIAASRKNLSSKTYSIMLGITAKMITDIGNMGPQVFNIRSYGAAVDGVTDDTSAVNATIGSKLPRVNFTQVLRRPYELAAVTGHVESGRKPLVGLRDLSGVATVLEATISELPAARRKLQQNRK